MKTKSDDIEAVRSVLRQAYDAWARNDAAAFAELYTTDATVVMPGVFHPDRTAIHGYMSAGFAGPLKGTRALDEERSVRVTGDAAIVISRSIILRPGEDGAPENADARAVTATWVLVRSAAGWQIAAYSNAPVNR